MYIFIIYAEISVNFHGAVIYSIMDLFSQVSPLYYYPIISKIWLHIAELVIYEQIQDIYISGFVFVYIYIYNFLYV